MATKNAGAKKQAQPAAKKLTQDNGFDFAVARDRVALEEAGIVIPIVREDGTPAMYNGERVTITSRGAQSPTFRKMHDEFQRSFYARRLEGVESEEERNRIIEEASEEREEAYLREVRVPNVTDWYGFTEHGEPVEPTLERVIEAVSFAHIRNRLIRGQERPQDFFDEASGG